MEKRNVVEEQRTPCLLKQGNKTFCDCPECRKKSVKQAEAQVDIRDIDSLARVHK